ncbi:MAG: prepilin-type N-terminal cleavage/methylation domain-containing protein [Phycisphaerae bacterium]
MKRIRAARRTRYRCRGVSLIEATVSMVVVAVMLVAAVHAIGGSAAARSRVTKRAVGPYLADGLMAEILAQSYQDPTSPVFGPEVSGGESAGSRAAWDDVDDYNGWVESPPRDKDGNAIVGMTGWEQSVAVAWVNPADLTQVSATESGAKRITVTVRYNGVTVATRVAVRTNVSP